MLRVCVCFTFYYLLVCYFMLFFFFFQAEDGIRDHCVTGVQTCALPISDRFHVGVDDPRDPRRLRARRGAGGPARARGGDPAPARAPGRGARARGPGPPALRRAIQLPRRPGRVVPIDRATRGTRTALMCPSVE